MSRVNAAVFGLTLSLIVFVFLTVRDSSLEWTATWWLWLFVLAGPMLALLRGRQLVAAGADWLRAGRAEVNVYELTELRLHTSNSDPYLELTDSAGRGLAIPVSVLQRNSRLWDLVYNGLKSSAVEGGASTDEQARVLLQLPG